jgi:hypothetical protein
MLLHPPGHGFQGKSIVPFGYGVVFTNITRKQFVQADLREVSSLFEDARHITGESYDLNSANTVISH